MARRIWGIQITEHDIRVALIQHGATDAVLRWHIEKIPDGMIDEQGMPDKKQLADLLRSIASQVHMKGNAILILPESNYVSRVIDMPPMTDVQRKRAIENDLSRFPVYQTASVLFDFFPIPVQLSAHAGKMVFVSSARKDIALAYTSVLRHAKIRLLCVVDPLQSLLLENRTEASNGVRNITCVARIGAHTVRIAAGGSDISQAAMIDIGFEDFAEDIGMAQLAARTKNALALFEHELGVNVSEVSVVCDCKIPEDKLLDMQARIGVTLTVPVLSALPPQLHEMNSSETNEDSVSSFYMVTSTVSRYMSLQRGEHMTNLLRHALEEKRDSKRTVAVVIIATILVNAGAIYGWPGLRDSLRGLDREMAQGTVVLSQLKAVTSGFSAVQAELKDITALDMERKVLVAMTNTSWSSHEITALAKDIPSGVTVSKVVLGGGNLSISGSADSSQSVAKLVSSVCSLPRIAAGSVQTISSEQGALSFACLFKTTEVKP